MENCFSLCDRKENVMSDNISVGGWCVCMETLAKKKKKKLFFGKGRGCKIDLAINAKCNVHIVALYLEGH